MKKALQELFTRISAEEPRVSFRLRFWDGTEAAFGRGAPVFVLTLKTRRAARRFLTAGVLGFGEEYTAGNIGVEGNLHELARLGTTPAVAGYTLSLTTRLGILWHYITTLDTKSRARRNIRHHYDLGNDFYRLWLDGSMTYSCAYFKHENDDLDTAQRQKYDHICRKLQLKAGETLVDIGCGWGGMLIHAAKHYGVKGLGCTLSQQQYDYARRRIREEGLEERITIELRDYRDLTGQYDKFVSIGMFEHVGRKFIPQFMKKVKQLLKPQGIGLLHTIGKDRHTPGDPWTRRYIFPGSYIPALDEIMKGLGRLSLIPTAMENLRLHYALTLEKWLENFEQHTREVEEMFDERFVRMWRFFLVGSSAGFRWGDTRLYQVTFTNGLNNQLPLTLEHIYPGAYPEEKPEPFFAVKPGRLRQRDGERD